MTTLRRNLKNVVCNYSEAQVKVREATSNDRWGPSGAQMSELSDMTYNSQAFSEIMSMLWKRLADKPKHWRHVCKALVLMDYLVKTGSEKVALQCRENVNTLRLLTNFDCPMEDRDQSQSIRDKAKKLIALLEDPERLKSERANAKNRMRGSDRRNLSTPKPPATSPTPPPPSQQQLPQPVIEATNGDIELEVALQVSREEYNLERQRRLEEEQREEIRLKSVLEASRLEEETLAPLRMPPPLNAATNIAAGVSRERNLALQANQQSQHIDYLDRIDLSLSAAPANAPDPWSQSARAAPTVASESAFTAAFSSASSSSAAAFNDAIGAQADIVEAAPEPPDLGADSFEPWDFSPFGAQHSTDNPVDLGFTDPWAAAAAVTTAPVPEMQQQETGFVSMATGSVGNAYNPFVAMLPDQQQQQQTLTLFGTTTNSQCPWIQQPTQSHNPFL